MSDLAKRWLSSPRWGGWRVGMADEQGRMCVLSSDGELWFHCGMNHTVITHDGHRWMDGRMPDLGHPGTRAFLLEDVRAAWRDDGIGCKRFIERDGGNGWRVEPEYGKTIEVSDDGGTEPEALILALEEAS